MIVTNLVAYLLFALCSTLIANNSDAPLDTSTVARCNGAVACCNSSFESEPVISHNSSLKPGWQPLYHTFPAVGLRRIYIITGSLSTPLRTQTLVLLSFVRSSYMVKRLTKLPCDVANFRAKLIWYGCYIPVMLAIDGFVPSHVVVASVVLHSHRGYVSRSVLLSIARILFSGIRNRRSVFEFSEVFQALFIGVNRIHYTTTYEIRRWYSSNNRFVFDVSEILHSLRICVSRVWYAFTSQIHRCCRSVFKKNVRRHHPVLSKTRSGSPMVSVKGMDLRPYLTPDSSIAETNRRYVFHDVASPNRGTVGGDAVRCKMPLTVLSSMIPRTKLRGVLKEHGVATEPYLPLPDLHRVRLLPHKCDLCDSMVYVFKAHQHPISGKRQLDRMKVNNLSPFPPKRLTENQKENIIRNACEEFDAKRIDEAGCSVCGLLTIKAKLMSLRTVKENITILAAEGLVRLARKSVHEPIKYSNGLVLANDKYVGCPTCVKSLSEGVMPKNALADGLWLGDIPKELACLTFAEKLLISRIRRNACIASVASGGRKLVAKAVMFTNPLPKVYSILPPPREDFDEVLAVIFTGPTKPTPADLHRTPFLVRRNNIGHALRWLVANHSDYADVEISQKNLASYPEHDVPVTIEYKRSFTNKSPESMSVHETVEEDGTASGPCPFAVHGMMGTAVSNMSTDALKTVALEHLEAGGKMLAVGHSEEMVSVFNNPQLYPLMFPWLFPYGSGGIGTTQLNHENHLKHLLMFHDKRFQTDDHFVLIAFHHLQVRNASLASFLVTEKAGFPLMAQRLLNLDFAVLRSLVDRLERGPVASASLSRQEKDCFELLRDIDVIGSHVDGFVTSKRFMRTEIWSLIVHLGAPSWYITISPADINHPLCIYWAGQGEKFQPNLSRHQEAVAQVVNNPVAAARFFHFMIELFIKHCLGIGSTLPGLFGDTEAYYGTVEQQGRLTLHLHLLLWLRNAMSPSQIRKSLNDETSAFWVELSAYLEACHQGEFMTGTQEEVRDRIHANKVDPSYVPPTFTLPKAPPSACRHECGCCSDCLALVEWRTTFQTETDDLLFRSNVHKCSNNLDSAGNIKTNRTHGGCLSKWNICKARFPRLTFVKTVFDKITGHINVKKHEPMMNTFNYVLTYVFRCNTDVTSLLSGTAVKAVVAYVTDYITKSTLKTHVMLGIILLVLQGNSEILNGDIDRHEKARKLMIKIVNSMGVKLEIGAPFVSLYLLGLPDHYTGHRFVKFNWRTFVTETMRIFREDGGQNPERVVIKKVHGRYIGSTCVDDYKFRPKIYESMCLYDWIRLARVGRKLSMKQEAERAATALDGPDAELQVPDDDRPEDHLEDSDVEGDVEINELVTSSRKQMQSFLSGHPLVNIRGVHCVRENALIVACLMGGSLPRRDVGDQEFYCATMLTLFKPWRSGLDLKHREVNWNTAFASFDFTIRQRQLMDNMNTQYECLDARDDYSTMLQTQMGVSFPHSPEVEEATLEGDKDRMIDDLCDHEDDYRLAPTGYRSRAMLTKIDEIRNRMTDAGWSSQPKDINAGQYPEGVGFNVSERHATNWSNVLNSCREKAIALQNTPEYQSASDEMLNADADSDIEFVPNTVKIVDKAYLDKRYKASTTVASVQCQIVKELGLNLAQERAFCIASNHIAAGRKEQLRMYVTGMAGTGKTTVLKALKRFFELRRQSQRFAVVAPTGSAASIIGGSTYHSMLNVNEYQTSDNATTVSKAKERLKLVDYIFLDEVSMISCRDLYRISAKLTAISGKNDSPFGGFNIIFAGDFAQLPPVIGGQNAALYGSLQNFVGNTASDQESAIGKALWHQVNTVVILRENMRQRTQSDEDAKLRTALLNMRYKKCDAVDIAFLNTLVARPGRNLDTDRFQHQSIITARNVHKDEINEMGCKKFAIATKQTLTCFYSVDHVAEPAKVNSRRVNKSTIVRPSVLTPTLKSMLWNRPASCMSTKTAGRLDLCLNLPVMIKTNAATELCVTNGQEGTVAGWDANDGSDGRPVLHTLFVRLTNPPKNVQLPDLPLNVVPLVSDRVNGYYTLPTGYQIPLQRMQVRVLPNFAMTDYASQGKTRSINVLDLSHCQSHQAVYTCLSRSADAANTLILSQFNTNLIRGEMSGHLRQEYRHLEIMDDITLMLHEGHLPFPPVMDTRNQFIKQYQLAFGLRKKPSSLPDALAWDSVDLVADELEVGSWHLRSTEKKSRKRKQAEEATVPPKKRKVDDSREEYEHPHSTLTRGIVWDANNWSCAYDSVVVSLYWLWITNIPIWSVLLPAVNRDILPQVIATFVPAVTDNGLLNVSRATLRLLLFAADPDEYRWGQQLASLDSVWERITRSTKVIYRINIVCPSGTCDFHQTQDVYCPVLNANEGTPNSTDDWLTNRFHERVKCTHCNMWAQETVEWQDQPIIIVLNTNGLFNVAIEPTVSILQSSFVLFALCYHGENHYTTRVVRDGDVWYHDGVETKDKLVYEGKMDTLDLTRCRDRNICNIVYRLMTWRDQTYV